MSGSDAAVTGPHATDWRETALYAPVKAFLEAQGFAVKGEVCGCDAVGLRAGEPPLIVVAELKLSFTLELVLQAVDRMRGADIVYLAVAASRRGRDQDQRVTRLCRLLGVGLLAVDLRLGLVTILCEPVPYRPRPNLPLRRRLVKEHTTRRGDPNLGGSSREPIMTAYRQRALACAAAMRDDGARPRDLRHLAEDAGTILSRNVYGWFERVRPGHYRLSDSGRAMIALTADGSTATA
ncbi:DUF2161 domain-containing phosphodiesterase [Sphingomonas sp. BK069]|uniref:DUF2161 domain-containing phosphodiesterase n=1 Tax=Sphingomonas sp. BK069 TaxID=2586979 RepID=UPI001611DD01|nr:DUF2161 family putative PD-(D/E)XK-type phosphodiesterase [Sphingomonas sp. BK069]MBB3349936.1 hypothetical protein [Sphingomonas sp. BK069]